MNILGLLSGEGDVDRKQLTHLFRAADEQERLKQEAFHAHVLELRDQLGDEKGARFFALLLENLKAKDDFPHR